MIITKLRIQEEHPMQGDTIAWPLDYCDLHVDSSAGYNGYILKNAVGIGPPDFISAVEGFDVNGVPIMESVPDKREIALRVAFRPGIGQSVQQLRSDLYRYISRSVSLSFMNQAQTLARINGFIQKFETLHFSSQPEIQITIRCKTGEFSSPTPVTIPLSVIDNAAPIITYNEGDAPTGLDLKFTVTAAHSDFTISNYGKFWHSGEGTVDNQFIMTYDFEIDDEITICTTPGKRKITLLRSAVEYDLAGYLNGGVVWPKLYPGVNTFDWDILDTWMSWDSATYTPKFWGV